MNAKTVAATLVVLVLLLPSGCSNSESLAKFQGEWNFVDLQSAGEAVEPKVLKVMSVKVTKDEFQIYARQQAAEEYTISVNSARKPAEIDLTHASGETKGTKSLGIYAFEGKTLKICIGGSSGARPQEFVAKAEEGQSLMVLEHK